MKMLSKIEKPPSFISRHDKIVDAKTNGAVKAILVKLRPEILKRYSELELKMNAGLLHQLSENAALLKNKDELQSCYKNKAKGIRSVFSEIENIQNPRILERCPYCGITLPNTFDHYLPEGKFPEYSASGLNLLPCCNDCNSTKGARWKTGGKRLFLNLYVDSIPVGTYLQVRLSTRPNALAYGVEFTLCDAIPAGCSRDEWDLILSHYNELKLLSKFKNQSNSEISNTFSVCVAHLKDGGSSMAAFLTHICDDEEAIFGLNHWRVVLKRALARSGDFEMHVLAAAALP